MHNPNPSQNLQAVACYSSSSHYYLRYLQTHRSLTLNETLVIDKNSQKIKTLKSFDKTGLTEQIYSAFLGIASIEDYKFMVFCDQCKRASSIAGMDIYQISSLTFLSYLDQEHFKESDQRKRIYEKIRDYYVILKHGFYFAHQYRLTLPFGKQQASEITATFVWNEQFLNELDNQGAPEYWKTPIIQGFVSSFEVFYQGAKIKYCLITRRSSLKGGTRFFDRGVNDEGYVANYCETEQIVKIDQFCFSDIQIRGSLPVFFQQVGLYTKTKVNRGFELTHKSFEKHFQRLFDDFKRVLMVNLLTMGKRGQKLLTQTIEEHIKAFNNPNLKYLYYDFHHKVKGGHYENVDQIIAELRPMKGNLGYYSFNSQLNKVLSQQAGVVRTNCLDCLDRTNFFMAKMAIITLEHIFRKLEIAQLDLLAQMRNNRDNAFIRKFRNIWADNGDAVSYHYTGTGSTHTDITRDGRRGMLGNIKHKYKTVTRFYNQNFWDFYKMKIVNELLGNPNTIQKPEATRILEESQQEFIAFQSAEVFILTWKAPKLVPKKLPQFSKDPQLIVVSIQDLNESDKWLSIVSSAIDKNIFMKVEAIYKNNNLLTVYAKHQLKEKISCIEQGSLKFRSYYNAFMSNKCANFIRFNLYDSKLVFVGCQLEKGRDFMESRIRNLKEIHEFAFQIEDVGVQKSQTILFDDAVFLIGNMNANVSPSLKNDINKLNSKQPAQTQEYILKKMLKTDEFHHIRMNLMECREYEEEPITFLPTYRYNNGQLDPEVSGWPDRIWYSSDSSIKCTKYDLFEELKQDHIAVIGRYQLQLKRINEQVQERVQNNLLSKQSAQDREDQQQDIDEKIPI